MCGINCIFDPQHRLPEKEALINQMNSQMIYRGPDDQGAYTDDLVAMGMRRLSIIDLQGGHQPLFNEDHTLVLVCNGEIYNYVELIDTLLARGHHFNSRSDAETILHLYEEKGVSCLEDLRGMFAFVLWDTKQRRLFAARDRVGIKPLYIAEMGGVLWLSSELKAIWGAADVSSGLHAEAIYQYLLYGYAIDQRNTVVQDIKRVLPGEYLSADTSGTQMKRYWLPPVGVEPGGREKSDEEVADTFQTAIKIHLRSDVPIGILLSSGLDSSAIAACAIKNGDNFTALCAGYVKQPDRDERILAHKTASQLGIPAVDVELDAEEFSGIFDEMTSYLDEPNGDVSAMPQWALYRQARAMGFPVLLSGIGGDEVFFGYPSWNNVGEMLQRNCSWPELLHQNPEMEYDRGVLHGLLGPQLRDVVDHAEARLLEIAKRAPAGPDAVAHLLFGSYLVHNGCFLADKLGMAHSVEVRVPLLDHLLLETVFSKSLPSRFESGKTKVLMRRLLRGMLPEETLARPKLGFAPPQKYTIRMINEHLDEIQDSFLSRDWLDHAYLEELSRSYRALPWINSIRSRKFLKIPRWHNPLYRVLVFDRWYRDLQ